VTGTTFTDLKTNTIAALTALRAAPASQVAAIDAAIAEVSA